MAERAGRRALARAALFLSLGLLGCQPSGRAPAGTPVVLVTIDTLRADRLAIYGHQAGATPAIDGLARDGVVFDPAWATVPLTLPSHASLFTGLLPPTHGVRDNLGYTLDGSRHRTLARQLSDQGYATGGFVSAFVLRAATGIADGFAVWDDAIERREGQGLGTVERPGDRTTAAAIHWLAGVADRPFFLFLHLFEPHAPYAAPAPFGNHIADPYLAEIAAADAALGRLLDELRRRDLYDRALIVLTADHGEGLGDHGEDEHGILLYREAIQVPLVIKLPDGRRGGTRVTDLPASLVDLLPTVTAQLGLAADPALPGQDLFARSPTERTLYAETFYPRIHLGWSELRAAIDGSFQFIAGPDPELFSLADDPAQRHNLLRDERRATANLSRSLAAIPANFATPGQAADPETLRKLAALGYLTAGSPSEGDGPRPDPKAEIGVLAAVREAIALARAGELAGSIAACRTILERQPQLLDVRLQLAWNLGALGAWDAAVATYQEVVRRSPEQLQSVALEVARLELLRGRLDEAAEQARLAQPGLPDDAALLLGEIALARGGPSDVAEALTAARSLLAAAPANPSLGALFLLARAQASAGDVAAAIATLEQARGEVASGRAAPLAGLEATYADLLARSGQSATAEAAFRREIAAFPAGREAYVGLVYLLAATSGDGGEIGRLLVAMVEADRRPDTALLAAETASRLGNAKAASAWRLLAEQRAAELGRALAEGSR